MIQRRFETLWNSEANSRTVSGGWEFAWLSSSADKGLNWTPLWRKSSVHTLKHRCPFNDSISIIRSETSSEKKTKNDRTQMSPNAARVVSWMPKKLDSIVSVCIKRLWCQDLVIIYAHRTWLCATVPGYLIKWPVSVPTHSSRIPVLHSEQTHASHLVVAL